MTATLDCPHCGAPLHFEPHPGDETVECSFCHETVIIPEDLRIPLPRENRAQQTPAQQPGKMNGVVKAFAWIGAITVFFIIIGIIFSSNDSPSDTPTVAPTIDQSGRATATFEAKATLTAIQPILKQAQSWPTSFTDSFTDNSHQWETGDVRDSFISGNRSISDGSYTWNITAVKSTSDYSFPTMADQKDFYAGVEMKLVLMPDDPDGDAGLVFRYNNDDQTWYYFSINDIGQYYFGWYDGKGWHTLIHETNSGAIHPGQTNRLAVGVQGSLFIFLINDQIVDHFVDNNLVTGTIGVGVNLPKTGEKATVAFSNFTVQSPLTSP